MNENTKRDVQTAIHGMMHAAGELDRALIGKQRGLNAMQALNEGPFSKTLHMVAEIADGGPIGNTEDAEQAVIYLFGYTHFLRGGFYSSLYGILGRAHVRLASDDLMTAKEAEQMVLPHDSFYTLELDAKLGHVHPLVLNEDASWKTWDATYLGIPNPEIYTVRYARYEIEARAKEKRAQ